MRRAYPIIALFSLLLVIAASVLWVSSHWAARVVQINILDSPWTVRSDHGVLEFKSVPRRWVSVGGNPPQPSTFSLPYPAVVALFGIAPTAWLIQRRDAARYDRPNRRRHPDQCPHCGYDLRASKHKCPECGTHLWPLLAAVDMNTPRGAGVAGPATRDATRQR